jgi:SPP1 family predicted phage head-tail adaptor
MLKLPIGVLRHRVEIQAPISEPNEFNEVTAEFVSPGQSGATYRTVAIEPLQGRELEYARQTHADVTHRVTMRYYSTLETTHRFVHENRYLNILSIIDLHERHRWHIVMCMEAK